jgi:predicted membrane channel-forming protein YqfA (hemolysin III family)
MRKILRFLGILLMGMTAIFTLLSGVGTTCVALDPTKYDSMKALAPFQWLYIVYVLAGIAIGVLGIRATVFVAKSRKNYEKSVFLALILGIVTGSIHMITSRILRGSSMPTDGVVYFTIFTLIYFLVLRTPKLRELALYEEELKNDAGTAGGLTAIVSGLLILSVQIWAGPTHSIEGVNYANAFHNVMVFWGTGLILLGMVAIVRSTRFPQVNAWFENITQ